MFRYQADLARATDPLRLAMNAARRAPRVQGIWVVVACAVLITDRVKRAFVMVCVLVVIALGLMPG